MHDKFSPEATQAFLVLIQGFEAKITENVAIELVAMASKWNAPAMTDFAAQFLSAKFVLVPRLRDNAQRRIDTASLESEVAKYFPIFSQIELVSLPQKVLTRIMRHPLFQLPDLLHYLQFVSMAINTFGRDSGFVFEQLDLCDLSGTEKRDISALIAPYAAYQPFKKILSQLLDNGQSLIEKVSTATQTMVHTTVARDILQSSGIHISYQPDEPFKGIFTLLNWASGGNAHTKGIINITASSSVFNVPHIVIDMGSNNCWGSLSVPRSWIKFDFKEKRIILNAYRLKTYQGSGYSCSHLKSWIVEGTNDELKWEVIDEEVGRHELAGDSLSYTWSCVSSQPFRFIRIQQIGPNHSNTNCMWLNNVEFFGDVH